MSTTYGTIGEVVRQVLLYADERGKEPFAEWLHSMDRDVVRRVEQALVRMEAGNDSNFQSVGGGVHEWKMNVGLGYRLYAGFDGATIIVLLGGGDKSSQPGDIASAKGRWANYKAGKRKSDAAS